ncbi:MAG: PorT family protein [Ignavibacteriales bacterium]|nr:PorT family protein [Ignavibacteriales bacterium]
MYKFNSQKLLLLFFVILIFNNISAQSVDIGIRAGVNLSSNSFEPELESITTKNESGLIGGLYFTFNFGIFSLQSEVLYSQKGSKLESNTSLFNLNRQISLSYLEFPLLIKYNIPTSKNSQINIFTGPSFGINLNSKYTIDEIDSSYEKNIKDETKATEVGWIFGLGFNLTFNKVTISIDCRYNYGFTKSAYLNDLFSEVYNGSFTISAGFSHRINL